MDNWSIGIDIIEIKRFKKINIHEHHRFYKRVFNDYEFEYCLQHKEPYSHFAGIFAAKEAALKALNEFVKVKLSQISILHNPKGKPIIEVDEDVKLNISRSFDTTEKIDVSIKVSITHSSDIAIAWVIAFINKLNNNSNKNWSVIKPKINHVIHHEFQNRFISNI